MNPQVKIFFMQEKMQFFSYLCKEYKVQGKVSFDMNDWSPNQKPYLKIKRSPLHSEDSKVLYIPFIYCNKTIKIIN